MKILVCNVGSTSLKFKLYEMPGKQVLAWCGIERVGSADDALFHYKNLQSGYSEDLSGLNIPDYETGIRIVGMQI